VESEYVRCHNDENLVHDHVPSALEVNVRIAS
jgi:hypothetical protein